MVSRLRQTLRKIKHRVRDKVESFGNVESKKVDSALVINLETHHDRMERLREQASKWSFPLIRISAVDGGGFDDSYRCRYAPDAKMALSRGQVACFLSHRRCWQHFLDSSDTKIWILEDDAQINNFLARHLDNWLGEVEEKDPDWEMIYTSRSTVDYFYDLLHLQGVLEYVDKAARSYDENFTTHSVVAGPSLYTDGYLLSRKGATKLLNVLGDIQYPIDVQFGLTHREIRMYAFSPLISRQRLDGISDTAR